MCRSTVYSICIALLLALLLGSAAQGADPSLVAWYKFDGDASDSSGNNLHGTEMGDPTYVGGVFGQALDLDGDGDYIDCGNPPEFDIRDQITFAFWFQVRLFDADWNTVIAKGDNSWRASRAGTNNFMEAAVSGTAGNYTYGVTPVDDGQWHHFAMVYDGTMNYLYLDGEVDATEANSGQITSSTYNVYIGENSQATGRHWNGLIDDVMIYNRALTQEEIQQVMQSSAGAYPLASSPSPADGLIVQQTWLTMTWKAGDFAASHDVYFSDNFEDVNSGAEAAFQGRKALTDTTLIAGFFGFPYPEGLTPGTTYYWRIDEVNDSEPNSPWIGDIWSFWLPPRKAYEPVPAEGAKFVSADVTLEWTAGFNAKLHYVYFGDDPDVVANATGAAPVSNTTFNPGPLETDKTYYWRVDEYDPPSEHKGDVWSFTTIPDIPVTDPSLIGWWKLDEGAGTVALDSSGHGNHGELHGAPQWTEGPDGGALDFDGSNDYVEVASDASLDITSAITIALWINRPSGGPGDDRGIVSRGGGWTDGGYTFWHNDDSNIRAELQGPNDKQGISTIHPPYGEWHHIAFTWDDTSDIVTIYIDGVMQTTGAFAGPMGTGGSLRIGDYGGRDRQFFGSIDDVRLYNKVLTAAEIEQAMRGDTTLAGNPSPHSSSTVDVRSASPLTWDAGDNAVQQDVYLATDRTAVEDADATDTAGVYCGRQAGTSFTPAEGLPWGTGPYFWRVDQVNNDGTIGKGRIWSFTVADFLIVDNFEDYTDNDPAGEAVWQKWIDGYTDAANGSQMGNLDLPYMELTIVQQGRQAVEMFYNNIGGVMNSEVELPLDNDIRNWTDEGVDVLSLWFHGRPASTGSFVEGPVGTFTMTGSGTDITGTSDEFHYAYKTLTGVGSIIAKVNSVQNTNAWAKAGVMIRGSLDPDAQHAMTFVTPGNGVVFEHRLDVGGSNVGAAGQETGITAPHWVKIERDIGGNFTASHSADGSTWLPLGIPENIQMGATIFIGLALTSHDADVVCEAVFSNVTTTGNVTGQWTNQDIGIASNAAEPLYVAIANATGEPVITTHPGPRAAQIDAWTEWRIPLQGFANHGIDLTDVRKLYIGLGTKGRGGTSGGSGSIFLDNITLKRPAPVPQP